MRVIAGILKGIKIPFVNLRFDNANTTPQKVKEALFSILGEDLVGKSFLDLYSCSGQIGIEALSRGAEFAAFNEIDAKRFHFIKMQIEKWGLMGKALLLNYHAFRCLRYLDSKKFSFDFIFIDPPYNKKKNVGEVYSKILNELDKHPILRDEVEIIIQHYADNTLEQRVGNFCLVDTRKYAKNALSFYKKDISA